MILLDRQIWYLCEAAQRCDRAIYLTVIDVAVVSGRDMIIRADHGDPFLRTRHDVPPESAREENEDVHVERRREGYSPGSILTLKMESGHSRSKLDASTRRTISVARGGS